MPRPLRAMLEGNAHPVICRKFGERFPKVEQLPQMISKRSVNRVSPALVDFQFNHRAWKSAHRLNPNVGSDLDRAPKYLLRGFRLPRIERVLVKRANGRDTNTPRHRFGGK